MGVFFARLSKAGSTTSSVEIAEIMAAWEAIVFAWESGFQDVILEGDNITIMNAICSNEIGLSSSSMLFADIFQMDLFCNRVSFSFAKREGNCLPHCLDNFTMTIVNIMAWLEDPLEWLKGCLLRDILSS